MAGYWPSSLFFVFMDRDEVEVHKDAKRLTRLISYLNYNKLTIKDLLYGIPGIHVALWFHFCAGFCCEMYS